MKRSEINALIQEAMDFFEEYKFKLPPFGHWTPEDWTQKGPESAEIPECQLGWDVTDFGGGDYKKLGLFLFTIRNGKPENLASMTGKTYAEKIMIADEGQVTPWHFHSDKMEDIINRGGGELVIKLANATKDEQLADTDVVAMLDGVQVTVPAQSEVILKPGESITLPPFQYHTFWGKEGLGKVLTGEVSRVNDDSNDNRFLEEIGRFPEIEEDEAPLRLLVGDYGKFYNPAK